MKEKKREEKSRGERRNIPSTRTFVLYGKNKFVKVFPLRSFLCGTEKKKVEKYTKRNDDNYRNIKINYFIERNKCALGQYLKWEKTTESPGKSLPIYKFRIFVLSLCFHAISVLHAYLQISTVPYMPQYVTCPHIRAITL